MEELNLIYIFDFNKSEEIEKFLEKEQLNHTLYYFKIHNKDNKKKILKIFVKEKISKITKLPFNCLYYIENDYGKPHINCEYNHNISYAGDMCMVAISKFNIGIDIEFLDVTIDKNIIDFVCSSEEKNYVNDNITLNFLKVWTSKESYLKFLGIGLVDNLREVTPLYFPDIFLEFIEFENYISCICTGNNNVNWEVYLV